MSLKSVLPRRVGGRCANDYTIIVAYDGERTEDDYFRGWKLIIPPSRLMLEPIYVKSGGNVLEAVKNSIKKKNKSRNFAEFWCVCDVDDTSEDDIRAAQNLAVENDIRLCLSIRCFEIWVALHFQYTSQEILNENQAIGLVNRHYQNYCKNQKRIPFHILYPRTDDAINNAMRLREEGVVNPSTSVMHLVRKFKQNSN